MGIYCVLCGKKDKSVSYIRFPSNKDIRKQWLKFCKKTEKNLYDSHRLCTDHFKSEDLKKHFKCIVVQPGAVPCIYKKTDDICSTDITSNDFSNDNNNVVNYSQSTTVTENITHTSSNQITSSSCDTPRKSQDFAKGNMSGMDVDVNVNPDVDVDPAYCNEIGNCEIPPNNCLTPLKQKDAYCSNKRKCLEFYSTEPVSNDGIDSTIPMHESPIPNPRYVGDIRLFHLATPRRAKRAMNVVRHTVMQQRRKIETLQKQCSRCKQRISSLKNLISDLKKRNYISKRAANNLMRQYKCGYCHWVLKEDQILLHSCLNIYDESKQMLIVDDNSHIFIEDIQNCDKGNIEEENSTERVENEVTEEIDNNTFHSINKQALDEELIRLVQKRPLLYDYRMPLKDQSRQKIKLWMEVSKDLNGMYTPIEAEKRWNYLRDCYRKSLNIYKNIKKSTQRSGVAGISKNQLIKPSFKHHHLMSFLNDVFQHRLSISSIKMVREPRASTSSAVKNDNSLDGLLINTISEENNENEFPLPSVTPNLSCRSTPILERKKRKDSGNSDEYDKILLDMLKKLNPIDCFIVRLAEGMHRLPYKIRSKLELEFLTKLNEVEEQLEFNN